VQILVLDQNVPVSAWYITGMVLAHQHFVTYNPPYYQQGLSIANPWHVISSNMH
jgi:hypothetical protein